MVIQRLDERTCSGFAAREALDAKGRRATATENLKPPAALLPGVLSGDGGNRTRDPLLAKQARNNASHLVNTCLPGERRGCPQPLLPGSVLCCPPLRAQQGRNISPHNASGQTKTDVAAQRGPRQQARL